MPKLSLKRRVVFAALLFICSTGFFRLPAASADNRQLINSQAVDHSQSIVAYVIGPQNVIQIKVFGDASINQIYRVDERGYIKHALLGSVKVGDMSVSDAEKLIETKLKGDYFVDPRVTIFILEHSHFSVLGEVKRPGTFEILGKTSIIEAISMAGGFTPVANQGDVKIIRKKDGMESTQTVDTTRITGHGDTSANVYIEADDVISIAKSFF